MKKKQNKITLGNAWSPYSNGAESTMTDLYESYQADPDKYLEMDGKIYVKIIHRCELYAYDMPAFLVSFEAKEELSIGDTLVDERGREFVVKAFERMRFAGNLPEWYSKTSNAAIQGKDGLIGNFLCKKRP